MEHEIRPWRFVEILGSRVLVCVHSALEYIMQNPHVWNYSACDLWP